MGGMSDSVDAEGYVKLPSSMPSLYRKYRPQTFADVCGQEHVSKTIQNQIKQDKVAHAYIFSGPRGVGKTTTARLLAKAVNCGELKDGYEPCGTCQSCEGITNGRTMVVAEIDAASHTGVDNVRENIIEAARVSPGGDRKKVFIIDEVHMLSTSAFNALLKTLEEPPAHVIFILATTELHKIPQTILSRCQRFDFHRISMKGMIGRLKLLSEKEGVKIADEVYPSIARLSEGCLRDAESILEQVLALGLDEISTDDASLVLPKTHADLVAQMTTTLATSDAKASIDKLTEATAAGTSVRHLLDELIEYVRDVMLTGLGGNLSERYDEQALANLKSSATALPSARARKLIDLLLTARSRPAHELFPQLPIEIAFVEFCEEEGSAQLLSPTQSPPPSHPESRDTPLDGRISPHAAQPSRSPQSSPPTQTPASYLDPAERSQAAAKMQDISTPVDMGKSEEILPSVGSALPPQDGNEEPQKKTTDEAPLAKFTAEDLAAKWGRCCELVAKRSVALPLVLKSAKPTSIRGNVVVLSFTHAFHFETCNARKHLDIIEEAVGKVMQGSVKIEPILELSEDEKNLHDLALAFGGSVVD